MAIDKVATSGYIQFMQTVGIKSLKNKLSEYIRLAAAGETVQVTDRGHVVAEITAPRVAADASSPEQKMAELIRQGLVRPATARLVGPPPCFGVVTFDELMSEIEADRADR
jgi:antitoxin (DNA-binding transcriptional repressor) of toxin-antitoxin stability system